MMKRIMIVILMCARLQAFTQTEEQKSKLNISAYLETYYVYDGSKPQDHNRPGFVYSYNRHNEVNLNLGLVKANYQTQYLRANLALMAGTYANANLSAEPGVLKNVYEANVGVKLSKKRELWIDAGIFSSHIGFESAIGKDCWNLTRSIMADNSPYYESGAKISYTTDNGKWLMSALVLNGWQRIQRLEGNNTVAFGHQLTFKPSEKITLNSSSFIGNDKPDTAKQMRYFHNFYGQFQLHPQWGFIVGFDWGMEQKTAKAKAYNTWYAPVLIVKYNPHNKHSIAARAEYYSDANGVIIDTNTPNGFKTWGYSLNYDYAVFDNVLWRIEGRGFTSKDRIFLKNVEMSKNSLILSTSLSVWL